MKQAHMKKLIKPCGFHCVKVKKLGVSFGSQVVLKDVNLHVHCGSILAVIGQNGAGKSTLIRAMLDEVPHTGSIEFKNVEDGAMQKIRVGYVPQHLNIDKSTPMDVYDLMASFRSRFPVFIKSGKLHAEIIEALKVFQAEDLIDQPVGSLSGGQLQRVLLSLSVMDDPDLLLLDEPVSGVDQNGLDLFYQNMVYIRDHFDVAIIIISHDLQYVRKYADEVILLDQTVLAEGSPEDVYASEAFRKTFGDISIPGQESPSEMQTGAIKITHRSSRSHQAEGEYTGLYQGKHRTEDTKETTRTADVRGGKS